MEDSTKIYTEEKMSQLHTQIRKNKQREKIPLHEMALNAAHDVDGHIQGRGFDYSCIERLADELEENIMGADADPIMAPNFPYNQVWKAIEKAYDKKIDNYSELRFETELVARDLRNVRKISQGKGYKRLNQTKDFCLEFYKALKRNN